MAIALALPAGALAEIAKDPQVITWVSFPTSKTYNDPAFWISARSDGGPGKWVQFSAEGGCETVGAGWDLENWVSTGYIQINSADTCTVTATVSGDVALQPGRSVNSFVIFKASQWVDFPAKTAIVGVGVPMSVKAIDASHSARAATGLPLHFESLTPDICSASDYWSTGWVVGYSAGSCTVRAWSDGNHNWYSAEARQQVTVIKASQTISYKTIPDDTLGKPVYLPDYFSSSSPLAISYQAKGNYCTVSGNWAYPTKSNFGTCYITASQPETSQYTAASRTETFNIGLVGTRIRDMLLADASHSYTCQRANPNGWNWCGNNWCAYYATTVWQRNGVDISDMRANPGSAKRFWEVYGENHGKDALPAVGDAVVFADADGTIQHVAIVTKVFADGSTESVGGNQGPNMYTSTVSVNPRGWAAGWSKIVGYVPPFLGNNAASTSVTYSMQTGQTASGSFTVASSAGSTSNLNMLVGPFYSDVDLQLHRPDGSLVSASDSGVTMTKLANSIQVSIQNADPGDWQYQVVANELDPGGEDIQVWADSAGVPTTVVSQDFDTTVYPQAVTFNANVMSPVDGAATPSGAVQFVVDGNPVGSPVALDDAGQASWTTTGLGGGAHTVSVEYLGSSQFVAPTSAPITHIVTKADQAVTFGPLADKTYGDADFTVGATASSGLTATFGAAGDCTVTGTTVHIVGAGSCTITASQAGDGNYNPAPDVAQSFSIAKKALTITANDATKLYGQSLSFAGSEFSVAGLVAGDGVTSVTLASAGQPAGAQPGSYDIVPSAAVGTRLSNYDIGYVNGTLTVNLVAIVGLDGVSVTGSGVFDAAPSGGVFVVSNGSITVTGSAAIRGDMRSTGGSVSLTGSAVVTGDVSAGTTIASVSRIRGLASPNSPVEALIAPAVAACSPYSSAAGLSGSYSYNPATGDLAVSGSKTVTIASGSYCFGSITLSGSAKLVVSGPVTISLTGKFSMAGSSVANLNGDAADLQISSSYAGSDGVAISGSGTAHFTVYAPAAQVAISGSPKIEGLVLGKSVTVSGSAAIRQDSSAFGAWVGYYRN